MKKIMSVHAREVLDSRGNPTVEAEVRTRSSVGLASVPSGVSTGVHEARELRDGGSRYFGMGVSKAVKNVNTLIARKLVGMRVDDQDGIDAMLLMLDGTPNKRKLGANAMLAVSLAVARCSAAQNHEELFERIGHLHGNKKFSIPVPCMNILEGGKHASNQLAYQEFMMVPRGKDFADTMRIASEMYHALKDAIAREYGKQSTALGDEGGFSPRLRTARDALKMLTKARKRIHAEKQIGFAMDCAASEFFVRGKYVADGMRFSPQEFRGHLLGLVHDFDVVSIEDPLLEEDFIGFRDFRELLQGRAMVVGDDLLCTNVSRIKHAIITGSCDCLLLKVNQIGTLTEALAAARLVQKAGWKVMVSHRGGETEDSFIADLAVGIGAEFIKAGAPARGERTAKYNRLLRISEHRKISG